MGPRRVCGRLLAYDPNGLPSADFHRCALEDALGPERFVNISELQQNICLGCCWTRGDLIDPHAASELW